MSVEKSSNDVNVIDLEEYKLAIVFPVSPKEFKPETASKGDLKIVNVNKLTFILSKGITNITKDVSLLPKPILFFKVIPKKDDFDVEFEYTGPEITVLSGK